MFSFVSDLEEDSNHQLSNQRDLKINHTEIIMPDKRKESLGGDLKNAKKAKPENSDETPDKNLTFDPVHFIRSHSKNNDPADIQTQVITDVCNNFSCPTFEEQI